MKTTIKTLILLGVAVTVLLTAYNNGVKRGKFDGCAVVMMDLLRDAGAQADPKELVDFCNRKANEKLY